MSTPPYPSNDASVTNSAMTPVEICAAKGHDWVIHDGLMWDTAECLTCGKKIRDIILRMSELPNRRAR